MSPIAINSTYSVTTLMGPVKASMVLFTPSTTGLNSLDTTAGSPRASSFPCSAAEVSLLVSARSAWITLETERGERLAGRHVGVPYAGVEALDLRGAHRLPCGEEPIALADELDRGSDRGGPGAGGPRDAGPQPARGPP